MTERDAEKFLIRALQLAQEAKGGVSPRPPVGAVIVKDGKVIGQGKTEPRPGVHAEVAAIRAAGSNASGATMYCTLEPHAHQGVAPPCTEAIIEAGIGTLVCPIEDPNPQVNGNGFRRLRSAGVEVINDVSDELRSQTQEMITGFKMLLELKRPLITLKYAMSLDGRIATASGESQWITGEEARAEAHNLRHESDAIITGIGTMLADNPRMTARSADGSATGRPRLRVVLDTHGRMPEDSALLQEPGDVLWVRSEDAEARSVSENVEAVQIPTVDGRLDVNEVAKLLGEKGVCNALLEAGGTLSGAFADAGLIDRVAVFIGPVIIGGKEAPGPIAGKGAEQLTHASRLEQITYKQLGNDILITGKVVRS